MIKGATKTTGQTECQPEDQDYHQFWQRLQSASGEFSHQDVQKTQEIEMALYAFLWPFAFHPFDFDVVCC